MTMPTEEEIALASLKYQKLPNDGYEHFRAGVLWAFAWITIHELEKDDETKTTNAFDRGF